MALTGHQSEAVAELVNIAFARAGAALAGLAGERVKLSVPEVSAHPLADLAPALGRFVRGEVATVHQVFDGQFAGDGLLVLEVAGARRLAGLLTGARSPAGRLGPAAEEAVTEVGNILLNACLGVFGDLLRVRITFAVPELHLESLAGMLAGLTVGGDPLRHALMVGARFEVRASAVSGCVVLVLGVTSMEAFVRAVEEWADRAGGDAEPVP